MDDPFKSLRLHSDMVKARLVLEQAQAEHRRSTAELEAAHEAYGIAYENWRYQ